MTGMAGVKARLMYWLVLRGACPCALGQRLRLPDRAQRACYRACATMDHWLYVERRRTEG